MKCLTIYSFILFLLGSSPFVVRAHSQEQDPPLTRVVWTDASFDQSARQVTQEFFGLHLYSKISAVEWPTVPFKTWRLHDAGTRWDELQPERDRWDFQNLDALVALAKKQQVEIVLVLGQTPGWASARPNDPSPYGPGGLPAEPAQLEDWITYVKTVATRYRGQIDYYELWNEANFRWFYTGSPQAMVQLAAEAYTVIKDIDPKAQIISPSVIAGDYNSLEASGAQWLAEYFELGGDRYTDIVAAHFYLPGDAPPEWTVPQVQSIRKVMSAHGLSDRPLWNTETGFGRVNTHPVDGKRAIGYVGRAHILQWAAGVERFQWYAWRNFNYVGLRLTQEDTSITVGGDAYQAIQEWLVGAYLGLCQIANDGTHTCPISRDNGDKGWILWNPNQRVRVIVPDWLQITSGQRLTGDRFRIQSNQIVLIGEVPILLERRRCLQDCWH